MNDTIKTKAQRVKALGYRAQMNLDNAIMDLERARQAARRLRRPMTPEEFHDTVTTVIEYLGEAEIQLMMIPQQARDDLADLKVSTK